jgi:ABC-type branched-subunit amino acid transport system ATPase component/branched-subunit amino acid ABC-type transport system permease component
VTELWQFALAGLAGGSAYALTALGVVAVYRGSGILNFAQGAIGMFGAYVFWETYAEGNGSLPVGVAAALGLLVGASIGVLFYVVVVRQLRNASDMAKVVSTLGLMLLLQGIAAKVWGTNPHLLRPLFGDGVVEIWSGFLTYDTIALVAITLVLAVALSITFRRSRLGMVATALRENPMAAAAVGISPHVTGVVTWGLGGALAALAGILLIPVISLTPSALTLLVIPAMAAALVGRFMHIGITVGVGLALGIVESALISYDINLGVRQSIPFAVILVAVLLGGRALPGRGEALTVRLPRVGDGRVRPMRAAAFLAVAVAIPLVMSPTWSAAMINSALFGLLALSMVVVTGYAGQISVAAAAFAGFGAFVAARASSDFDLPFLACLLVAVAGSVLLGVLLGSPAVRVRGVNLAIVTLGLSLAVENLVLLQPSLTGNVDGLAVRAPTIFGFAVSAGEHPQRYAIVCVVALALAAVAVLNVRRGESGRRYLAVRANERGAAAVGVSVSGAKLGAFAVSAGLAGLAGGLAAFQFNIADFSGYGVFRSIFVLAFTVVAGIGFVAGALFAALTSDGGLVANFVANDLDFDTIDQWLPILSGIFVLDVMIRFPDGIIVQLTRAKDAVVGRVGRPAPDTPAEQIPDREDGLQRAAAVTPGETILSARGVRVAYGHVVAVRDVSLELRAGEVLGVIGPNGAGKTSLIDALSGFATATGAIELRGSAVQDLGPVARARRGLARTFQNLELFDDLSVRENLLTALDSRNRLAYARDLVRPDPGRFDEATRAAVAMLDLEQHLDTRAGDLPQGVRRMTSIARLVAQRPDVVMLDEPAAGLNGAERRTAVTVFRALADELGAAVLLVEHNVDVVAAACNELVVLNFGEVIASGPTPDVLRDPAVRSAYLGRSHAREDTSTTVASDA